MSNSLTRRSTTIAKRPDGVPAHTIPKNCDLILADVSSSMRNSSMVPSKSCWDCLCDALRPLAGRASVIAFSHDVFDCSPDNIPRPYGSTGLHKALKRAISCEPIHVLVISDGLPDAKAKSLEQARILAKQTIIDVLYVGPDNTFAKAFMRELATIGRGRYSEYDLQKSQQLLLGDRVSSLLALPVPKSIAL